MTAPLTAMAMMMAHMVVTTMVAEVGAAMTNVHHGIPLTVNVLLPVTP